MESSESHFIRHVPCSSCGSSDGNGLYSDGHQHCFVCAAHIRGDGESTPTSRGGKKMAKGLLPPGEVKALRTRGISATTARVFNYQHTKVGPRPVQIAPYYDAEGTLVAQKVRTHDKQFSVAGDLTEALPFGAHAWPKTGKMIVVTEGEIDAMAMSQVQGNAYPVVSIACGAGPQVRKYIARHLPYFAGFERVVLMFDSDTPGREAAKVAAEVLGPRARIAELPMKDPAEMLLGSEADRKALVTAMWNAKPWRPEGIVDLFGIKALVKDTPKEGLSWCFPSLTKLTHGKRTGEIVAVGAGTGVGKTDFLTQDMVHMVAVHGQKIGVFALEQMNQETGIRLVGKAAQCPLHIPENWDEDLFDTTWDALVKEGSIFVYNSFGMNEWDAIKSKMEYLYHSEGVQYFYLDHLTALAAAEDDERTGLERIMAEMGAFVKAIPIHITFVSHLATPEGKPHEEGGRVMIRHFKGARAIGFWSHFMVGLERAQQDPREDVRTTTTFRILKDRYTGRGTGQVFFLGYNYETGILYEREAPNTDGASTFGFDSEAGEPADF